MVRKSDYLRYFWHIKESNYVTVHIYNGPFTQKICFFWILYYDKATEILHWQWGKLS